MQKTRKVERELLTTGFLASALGCDLESHPKEKDSDLRSRDSFPGWIAIRGQISNLTPTEGESMR